MRKVTREQYKKYVSQIANINGIDAIDVAAKFTVEPSVSQTLEEKIQESSGFLKKINIVPVDEQSGDKIGLGIDRPVASTTNTDEKDREPIDPTSLDEQGYVCTQTNFDTALKYSKLDSWAKFKDFQVKIRNQIVKRQALDRIMIGWNGTKRARTSDFTVNKLLQDVNIGWLEKIRKGAPDQVMSKILDEAGAVVSEKIRIGKAGDYHNLDALVMDAVNELIAAWFQDDTELVAIVGRSLLADKYFPIVNKEQENSEMLAADVIISQKRIGGLQAVRVPSFPDNTILITRLDNLSIYWQDGTRRRHIIDNPKRDRIENYESVNEAYVVEDYQCAALIENIEILKPAAPAPTEG
ncbi:phage major capsid protein, P2 family [Serratia liquefaciens]|uniref:phage major capsid protein, P2 family n=1 Tax=Serratia TaxID=613 RepID=UPI00217804FE|nr:MULTISPECIES: phage major capsid protein, P2 family [Serratia]CAI0994430.1 phage major capsid protein, P2 family [Serratia proteamaculans]CAI0995653.1 phage major capsid protein, P2 family [Serratia liquefaciens]CAI1521889.1 phage major capsid protein, P2 family [Serratia liquefaciens]